MVQKKSMSFVRVGPLQLLPPGSVTHLEMDDGSAVAVCNVAGVLHALDGICPHSGGPLGHGALDGPILTCPFHGWEFDCRTGSMAGDDLKLQATYPVKVKDGDIFVELP
jgi:nitrite reductase/ring-hydroxylating ferredoxin subunit